MFFDLIIQGYSITTFLLILLHYFNSRNADLYLHAARMANRILWLLVYFMLVLLALLLFIEFLSYLSWDHTTKLAFEFVVPEALPLLVAVIFVIVVLVLGAFKQRRLLSMFICSVVLNFAFTQVRDYELVKTSIYTLAFLVLIVVFNVFSKMVKKDIIKLPVK